MAQDRQTDSPAVDSHQAGPDGPDGQDARPEGLLDVQGVMTTPPNVPAVAVRATVSATDEAAEGNDDLIPYDSRPDVAEPLTAMQWRFVQHWFTDLNATQAARRAGYSSASAAALGARQVHNPRVARVLTELMPSQLGMSKGMVLSAFARIAGSSKATYADQIAALDKLSKAIGLYREQPMQAAQINITIYPGEADL